MRASLAAPTLASSAAMRSTTLSRSDTGCGACDQLGLARRLALDEVEHLLR